MRRNSTKGLKATFKRILPRYFCGAQPVAMSLTGGLDGRLIMAWAGNPAKSVPCYTFGGSYRECADVQVAKRVALACRQRHHIIRVDSAFLGDFPRFARNAIHISDGAMDITGSVELYVNRIAREIAPVRLTGNYGSEILRGNVAFRPGRLKDGFFDPAFEEYVRAAATTYANEARCHPLTFIAFKQVPWHHYSRLSIEQSQLTIRSPYLDNDLVSLMYQAPPAVINSTEPSFRLIAEANPALSRIPTDRGLRFPPVPMATRLQNFSQQFTTRAEYAYDYGMPHWLAGIDRLLSPLRLERLFLGRHKFCHFRVWYRDHLAQYLKEVLLDPRTRSRPYLRGHRLEAMVKSHIAGRANFTSELHCMLALELIQRELIEAN